MEVFVKLSWYW